MSAIAGLFGLTDTRLDPEIERGLLLGLQTRGGDYQESRGVPGAFLGVSRAEWESGPDFAGEVGVLQEGSVLVAADATLYYQSDLRAALRRAGAHPGGDTASHLIAAAYRAWGEQCPAKLEGDFAFLLWDGDQRKLLAARDPIGSRPLFHAVVGEGILLGSSLRLLAAFPGVSERLDLTALGEDLIAMSSRDSHATAFTEIHRVAAGELLLWSPEGGLSLRRFWEPPLFEQHDGRSLQEAAEEFRELLARATLERLAGHGPTAVWMSGGYDSTSVFASARSRAGDPSRVLPVSMSYPPGDRGREDEFIQAVADRWGAPVRWVPIASVDPFDDPVGWGARRDEPFCHPFEQWNRALTRGAREVGARVVLGGNGGDQLFGVSPIFLADLFRRGQWGRLAREGRAFGLWKADLRTIFRWTALPLVPESVLELVRRVRDPRSLRPHLSAFVPPWVRSDFVRRTGLLDRQWAFTLRRPGESLASAETAWYFTGSFGPRVVSSVVEIGLSGGVELRSPLYDPRVIAFAARRPREERASSGQKKYLLRRSMTGLLPDSVLAPRKERTGLPGGYLRRALTEALPRLYSGVRQDLHLADLGLVDPEALDRGMQSFLRDPARHAELGARLLDAMALEHWLRAPLLVTRAGETASLVA